MGLFDTLHLAQTETCLLFILQPSIKVPTVSLPLDSHGQPKSRGRKNSVIEGVSNKKVCDGLVDTDRLGKYKCGKHVYTSKNTNRKSLHGKCSLKYF